MFGLNFCVDHTEVNSLRRQNDALSLEVENLGHRIDIFKQTLASINDATRNSSFEFDFNSVTAFSIERNIVDGLPCTIIGYIIPNESVQGSESCSYRLQNYTVKEWNLHCSEEQHEKLVVNFNTAKKQHVTAEL